MKTAKHKETPKDEGKESEMFAKKPAPRQFSDWDKFDAVIFSVGILAIGINLKMTGRNVFPTSCVIVDRIRHVKK